MKTSYICVMKKLFFLLAPIYLLSLFGFSANPEIALDELTPEFQLNSEEKTFLSPKDDVIVNHAEPFEYAPSIGGYLDHFFDQETLGSNGHIPAKHQSHLLYWSYRSIPTFNEPTIFFRVSQMIFPFHYHW